MATTSGTPKEALSGGDRSESSLPANEDAQELLTEYIQKLDALAARHHERSMQAVDEVVQDKVLPLLTSISSNMRDIRLLLELDMENKIDAMEAYEAHKSKKRKRNAECNARRKAIEAACAEVDKLYRDFHMTPDAKRLCIRKGYERRLQAQGIDGGALVDTDDKEEVFSPEAERRSIADFLAASL